MYTLEAVLARYESKHGRITTDALRKLRAFHILTQGTCECGYCGRELLGDADAEFDHMDANGAAWREMMPTRKEFMMINDGTHPEATRRKFACDMCNRAKGTMPYEVYVKSAEYRRRQIEMIILKENAARIEAYVKGE